MTDENKPKIENLNHQEAEELTVEEAEEAQGGGLADRVHSPYLVVKMSDVLITGVHPGGSGGGGGLVDDPPPPPPPPPPPHPT